MHKLYVLLAVLALAALLPTPSAAELPFTIYGQVGYGKIMEDNAPDGGIGFGGGIIYPFANSPFAVGAELGYDMLGKESFEGIMGVGSGEWTFSTIPVTAQAYYIIPTSGSVGGYLDAGAGFYNFRVKTKAEADLGEFGDYSIDETNSETDLGVNLGGGLKFGGADSNMKFGADAKFHIIMTEGESTNMVTVFGRIFFE